MKTTDHNIRSLDGLRGVACLFVVFAHAGGAGFYKEYVNVGQLGVMLFFALSGFLLTHHYIHGLENIRQCMQFWIIRIMRIYPAFLATVAILWCCESLLGIPIRPHYNLPRIPFSWSLYWDIVSFRNLPLFFWPIPVEITFYVLFPFFVFVLRFLQLSSLQVIMMLSAVLVFYMVLHIPRSLTNLLFYVPLFMSGIIAALSFHLLSARAFRWLQIFCSYITVILLVYVIYLGLSPAKVWGQMIGLSFIMGTLVFSAAYGQGFIQSIINNTVMRWVGMISYSLYLSHPIILYSTKSCLLGLKYSQYEALFFAVIMCLLIAAILYYTIERTGIVCGRMIAGLM